MRPGSGKNTCPVWRRAAPARRPRASTWPPSLAAHPSAAIAWKDAPIVPPHRRTLGVGCVRDPMRQGRRLGARRAARRASWTRLARARRSAAAAPGGGWAPASATLCPLDARCWRSDRARAVRRGARAPLDGLGLRRDAMRAAPGRWSIACGAPGTSAHAGRRIGSVAFEVGHARAPGRECPAYARGRRADALDPFEARMPRPAGRPRGKRAAGLSAAGTQARGQARVAHVATRAPRGR